MYERGATELDRIITSVFLNDYVDSGCVPASEIAVVKAPGPSLNRDAFMTHGRTDPAKLRALHDRGHTIRLGNLQRVVPFLAAVSRDIQQETGYSNYVHAFMTPPGNQGLRHHWDQQLAVIAQISGIKRWQLWLPPVEAPMREFNESWRVWREDYIPGWDAAGPDIEIDLRPGQSLLLPRGWVHNPYVADPDAHSVHLTFAIRERTPLWLAEKLIAGAIEEPAFRRIVLPGDIAGAALAERVRETRDALVRYLGALDMDDIAVAVRRAARTELEYLT
ncbi:cupin domain-containing protein [Streptomyces sp. NPDC091212]|uniref:JmjC domain-containing protein n=1 Tax=Streptomyces sp. NPDC091212 TaxID=3155191 RepID=UPI0034403CB0